MTWVYHASTEVDGKSSYPSIISVNIIFTVLSIICVSLRFWLHRSSLALDEWITLATLVCGPSIIR